MKCIMRFADHRTSGPVNAHLIPGPGIYFNAFIHFIAPGQGQTTPWGQMLRSTESPYPFAHVLQVLKQSLWSPILYTFFSCFSMCIAPGRGRQHIGDKILMTTERPFLFAHMLQVSKWSLQMKSDFFNIFNDFIHVYCPGQGHTTPWGQTFEVNRKP